MRPLPRPLSRDRERGLKTVALPQAGEAGEEDNAMFPSPASGRGLHGSRR